MVRHIQEARKDADYNVDDRISVEVISDDLADTVEVFKDYIANETLSKIVTNLENADLEKEISIEGKNVTLKLKK